MRWLRLGSPSSGALAAWLVLLLGATDCPAEEDVRVTDEARLHFEEGVHLLQSTGEDRLLRAYEEFQAAYAASPSWKILGNLGIVAQALERNGEAIDAFEAYLARGGNALPARERKQFERDLQLLHLRTATLVLALGDQPTLVHDTRLRDSGAPVINRYGPLTGTLQLRVTAGVHQIRVEPAAGAQVSWQVSTAARETVEHSFVSETTAAVPPPAAGEPGQSRAGHAPLPAPIDPPQSPQKQTRHVWHYVAIGGGTAAAGLGLWSLIRSNGFAERADAAYARCEEQTSGACYRAHPDGAEALRLDDLDFNHALLGYGALAAGIAGAGWGVWRLVTPAEAPAVMVGLSPQGVLVSGSF